MLTIALTLLAGRYHATPWGHHANEGQIEWPPSPWRLARALAAVAYTHRPDGPDAATRALLVRLASSPPVYRLPASRSAHLRHYMPLGAVDSARGVEKTAKVLDAFAAVDRTRDATIWIHWPTVALTPTETADLSELCAALSFLGRAESWVEATVTDSPPDRINARPVDGIPDPDTVSVAMLATEESFSTWLSELTRGGRPPKQTPRSRWESLTIGTEVLHAQRWSAPPGLVHTSYRLTRAHSPSRALPRPVPAHRPRVALFALHNRVLPREEDALVLGELAHRALVARSDGHPAFTGRDTAGQPMKGHRHARYLPMSRGGQGIDTLLVTCRDGFDGDALAALSELTDLPRTDGRGSREDTDRWSLTLVGLGEPADFARPDARPGSLRLPALSSGTEWISSSPFVAPRHPKRRGGQVVRDGVLDQARVAWERQLARIAEDTGQTAPRVLAVDFDGSMREGCRWAGRFKRSRRHGGGRSGPDRGYALRVRLSGPVCGPIALGYAAHFGLGVFVPVA